MLSLRSMVQEAAWTAVMTVLARARVEAADIASVPPLIMAKREQVIDILTLLQPFEEALQVKYSNGNRKTQISRELCNIYRIIYVKTMFFYVLT